jgi:hypothetical protein
VQGGALNTQPTAIAGAVGGDGDTSWMKSGAEARAAAEAEKRRQAERQAAASRGELYQPRRLEIEGGGTREIIVLDAQLMCFMHEHQLYLPNNPQGRRTVFEPCPREHQICPLCEGMANARESYYAMFLTVIELSPGYMKEGQWITLKREVDGVQKDLEYIRRLYCVKLHQQDQWFKLADELGNLRGLQLVLQRSATDRMAPQSGVINVEASKDEQGNWIVHKEADILESFGSPAEYSEPTDGSDPVVLRAENQDCFPYDYGVIFKRPSAEDLRTRYGGANAAASAPAGSKQANEAAAGGAPW